MSSLSFKSLSFHWKPEVDCKVTDVWAAAVVERHWTLRWMHLEHKLRSDWLGSLLSEWWGGSLSLGSCFCLNKEFNNRYVIGVLNGMEYLLKPQRLWHSSILVGNRH